MFGSAARTAAITRRRFLGTASAVSAAAAASVACGGTPHRIRLGTGLEGGLFHEFGSNLAAAATRSQALRITTVPTAGSVTNLEMLELGTIDAALALADAAVALGTRGSAIGRLYETYIHLAVRGDSWFQHIGDLRGARVDLGIAGSGAALTADRLFRTAGMEPGIDITVSHHKLSDAIRGLRSETVDAVVWGAGVPTPDIQVPALVRLLGLGEWVQPMWERYHYAYDRVPVPANTYPGTAAFETIGVPVLLLAAPALPESTVVALADVLLHHSGALMSERARGFQFFDRRWLVSTGDIPLHPAAADYYRSEHG
ncbi:TAXI family TRAP transporter solute-binding subunit [Nocardia carnea]|uniref:TAXI family TRAP transporter solute-binding subunit n=1 Tax=Nocardia carnea TaxID=37328 RepID=UPI0024560557|nr:TAXI family TRAP transporter solute-binding subunit [Nocardia carnea]